MDIQNSKDSKDHISGDMSDIKVTNIEGNNLSNKDMTSMSKKRKIDDENSIKTNKKLKIANQEIFDNEKREGTINIKNLQDTQDRNIVTEQNKKKRGRPRMEKNNSNIPNKETKKRIRKSINNEVPSNIQNQNEPEKNEEVIINEINSYNEIINSDLSNSGQNNITKGKRGRKPKNNEVSSNIQNQNKSEKNETVVIDETNDSHNEIINNDLNNSDQNKITKGKRGRKPKNNEISSNIQNQGKSEKNEANDNTNNSHNEIINNDLSNSDQNKITKGKRGRKPKNNEVSSNIQNQDKSVKNEVIDKTNNNHNEIINNDLSNSDLNKITKGKRGRKLKNNEISSNIQIQNKSEKNETVVVSETNDSHNEIINNDLSNSDLNKITKGKRGRKPKNNEVSLNIQNQDKSIKNETIVIDEINNSHNEINNNDSGQNKITKGKRGRKPKNNEVFSNIQNQNKSEKNETVVINEANDNHNEIINNDLNNSDQNKIKKSKRGRKPKNNEISSNIQNQDKSEKNEVIDKTNNNHNEIINNDLSNSDPNKITKDKRGRKPKNNEVSSNIKNQDKSKKNETIVIDEANNNYDEIINNELNKSDPNKITKSKRGRKPKNNEISSNFQNQNKSEKIFVVSETNDSHNEIIDNDLNNSEQNIITKGKRGRKPKNNEASLNIQNQDKSVKNEVIDKTNNNHNEIINNDLSNSDPNKITKGKRGRKPKNNEISSNIQNQDKSVKNEVIDKTNNNHNEIINNDLSNSDQNKITKGKRGRKPKNNEASSNIQNQGKSVKNEVIDETNNNHNEIINNDLSNSDQNKITKGKRGRKPKNNEVSLNIQYQDKFIKNEIIVIDETNNGHIEIINNDLSNSDQNKITKGKRGRKPKNNEASSNIQNQDKSEKNEVIDKTNNNHNEIINNDLNNSDLNKITKGKRGRKPKNNEISSNIQIQNKSEKNETVVVSETNDSHNEIINNDLSNSDLNKITKGKRGRKPKNNEVSLNIQNQDKSIKNETIVIDEINNSHNEINNNDLGQNKITKGKRGRKPKNNEISSNIQDQDKSEKNETVVINETSDNHNEIINNDLSNSGQNKITKSKRGRKPKNNEASSNIQNQDKSEKNEVIDKTNNNHNEIINNDLSNSDPNKITKGKRGRKPKYNEISSNVQNQDKFMNNETIVIDEANNNHIEIINNDLSNSDQNKIIKGKRGRKPKNIEVSSNIQNQDKSEKNEAIDKTNNNHNEIINNDLTNSDHNKITKGKRGRKPKSNLSQTSFSLYKNIPKETNEVNLNQRLDDDLTTTLSLNEENSKNHLNTENKNASKLLLNKKLSFQIVLNGNPNKCQNKSDDLLNKEMSFSFNENDASLNRGNGENKNEEKRDNREPTPILEGLNKEKKVVKKRGRKRKSTMNDLIEILSSPIGNSDENVQKRGRKRKSTMEDPIEILSSPLRNSDENVKKRGRKRKSLVKNPMEIFSSPKKNSVENERKENLDDSDEMPTAEEILDWSCNEHSREIKKSEINKLENKKVYEPKGNNVKDQDPFDIINNIFSSSDEEDLLVDKTLTIPGETVLAYYSDDRRYHPAKIISYSQKTNTYKLLFWTNYKKNLKRNKFYTKYQPEFLTVELGEQNTDKDEEELRHYEDKDLLDLIQEFIPKANEFLKKYSLRYKNFIDEELSSSRTNKLLIKNIFMGYFNTIEIEYIVDQFKLSLINKSLILDDLPLTIKPNEEKLKKIQEQIKFENSNNKNEDNLSLPHSSNYHSRSNTKGKDLSENISDSQKSNTSDSLTSCLRVNEVIYIDKLCRYVLLPEFTIWICMKEEEKNYEESEKFCKEYKKNYDWVNEVLHYRETFTSGRYFLMEHQNQKNY